MAHDDSTPPPPRPTRRPRPRPAPAASPVSLPEDHLALVVEDALAAVDARSEPGADGAGVDLRAALLYGWAISAVGARELAARSTSDLGLRHLLSDRQPSFAELRGFRETQRAAIEADFAKA